MTSTSNFVAELLADLAAPYRVGDVVELEDSTRRLTTTATVTHVSPLRVVVAPHGPAFAGATLKYAASHRGLVGWPNYRGDLARVHHLGVRRVREETTP